MQKVGAGRPHPAAPAARRVPAVGGARIPGGVREPPASAGVPTAASRIARAARAEWIPPGDVPPPAEPPEWPPEPPQSPPPAPDEVPIEDPDEIPDDEPDDTPGSDFRRRS